MYINMAEVVIINLRQVTCPHKSVISVCKRIQSSVYTGTTLTVILNSLQRVRLSSQTDKYPTSFPEYLFRPFPRARERGLEREKTWVGTSLIKIVLDRLYSRK